MQATLRPLTLRERFGMSAALAILVLFSLGSWLYRVQATPSTRPSPLPLRVSVPETPVAPMARAPTPTPSPAVVVHVTGAVRSPGVYTLATGQRVIQAIQKAGGFRRDAQRDGLNLAARLQDGIQIIVPSRSAPRTPPVLLPSVVAVPRVPASRSGKLLSPADGTVNLNTADATELQRLPGVGPGMAQRILQYRAQQGSFRQLDELKEVPGIGEKRFAQLQAFIRL